MRICPRCRSQIDDNIRFCNHCGYKLAQSYRAPADNTVVEDGPGLDFGSDERPDPYRPDPGQGGGYTGGGGRRGGDDRQRNNLPILIAVILIAVALVFLIFAIIIRAFFLGGDGEDKTTATTAAETTTQTAAQPATTTQPAPQPTTTATEPEPEPTTTSTTRPAPEPDYDYDADDEYEGCIFPDSNERYIRESELSGLSSWEIRVARNEIYARRGRTFDDDELQDHFEQFDWYHGTTSPDSFNDGVLNDYERTNAEMIRDYENRHGMNQ